MKAKMPLCLGVLLALTVAGGCQPAEQRLSARQYFIEATESFNDEGFAVAVERYNHLLDQYPLNPYAEEAQLKIAYAHYLNTSYAEAIAAFGDFERMYPISPHMPFVEYSRGMCYLRQMRTADRDQGVTEKALYHFHRTVERYPNSPFAPIAQEKIQACRESLAEHELYVADFYVEYYNAGAAVSRLRDILENYPDTKALLTALSRIEYGLGQAGRKDLAALAKKTLAYYQNRTTPTKEVAKVALSSPSRSASHSASLAADDPDLGDAQDRSAETDPRLLLIAELRKLESQFSGADSTANGKATYSRPTQLGEDVDSQDGFR
jgi:outer membrane protein assembly factor BamD